MSCKTLICLTFLLAIFAVCLAAKPPRTCHSCSGLTCLRTSYEKTEQCLDSLDFCVTIFDKSQVIRRGCYLSVPEEERRKCDKRVSPDCHKCNENKCNTLNREDVLCIQCDSDSNPDCKSNPSKITPTRCNVPSGANSYCYVKYEDKKTIRGCSVKVAEQRNCLNDIKCMLCLPKDVEGCNRVEFEPGSARSLFIF
ncbi:uncharacterized protein LOC129615764 [Condylostylus longicornis]|uniref:uncharacterized protein LOC129615764 n=1 Tax=Condylostylus longicornis TaxID=2530218 RepID=UPI00244E3232|nr:uncharacterized protein LOC129615764 [Condylostylus longicornis]